MQLKVMEFNIEYGGELVDFSAVLDAIVAGGASVVAIEEACGNMEKIARDLGWPYFDQRSQVVSKHPLLAPEEAGGLSTFLEIEPGRVVAIVNVHLPDERYGPFEIGGEGADAQHVLAIEEAERVPAIEEALRVATELENAAVPVFVAGDFNAPSHLDYTDATVGAREHVKFPVEWPVSKLVEQAGFVDSFRATHPDPVAEPGITWPAFRPRVDGYNPGPDGAVSDRIDFIYAGGPATALASEIVGEDGADGVDVAVSPWPTDHRAIVSTFEVTPAPVPTLLSAFPRVVSLGGTVQVAYRIEEADADDAALELLLSPAPTTGVDRAEIEHGTRGGSVGFDTTGWQPGRYDVALHRRERSSVIARTTFWVRPRDGAAEIVTGTAYRSGEPIVVEWRNAPGNRADWVGVYERGDDPRAVPSRMWRHTRSAVDGSLTFDDRARGFPLDAGDYTIRLLEDDGFDTLASAEFTVTD
jgi:hypothetical protein